MMKSYATYWFGSGRQLLVRVSHGFTSVSVLGTETAGKPHSSTLVHTERERVPATHYVLIDPELRAWDQSPIYPDTYCVPLEPATGRYRRQPFR